MEQDRVHESKSNADRFIVSRYGQNVDEEEDARSCCCFVIVIPVVMFCVVEWIFCWRELTARCSQQRPVFDDRDELC